MAFVNREGLQGRDDFIGFTFKGRHSSEFNIIQVSNNNRMGKELIPSPKDTTIQVTGVDGSYYFNSVYGNRTFSISFAYNDLRENNFREMQAWLADKTTGPLIFDEEPYKAWDVKISSPLKLNFICFNEDINGATVRVYKGEGTVSFVSYSIVAKAPFPFLDAYNWDYVNNKLGYDISASYDVEKGVREKWNKYTVADNYSRRLLVNNADIEEQQVFNNKTLDERLGTNLANSNPYHLLWYNFNEWKDASKLKTYSQMDLVSTTWETLVNGHYKSGGGTVSIYPTIVNKKKKWITDIYKVSNTRKIPNNNHKLDNKQEVLSVGNNTYRRYGYLNDLEFTSWKALSPWNPWNPIDKSIEAKPKVTDTGFIILDNPFATRFLESGSANNNSVYMWENKNIQDVDYRRKMTRFVTVKNSSDVEVSTYRYNNGQGTTSLYTDTSKENGGTGTGKNVTDAWASKIGPVRGITGRWCHIYNPGNYKTYPKIILTVMDKRSMITRSRCNYPNCSAVYDSEYGQHGRYKLTIKDENDGNYDWRYATITLYPNYEGKTVSELTEKDVLGRISLDLMKLVPKNSSRDGDQVNYNGKPSYYYYVIDCELRLIYRISSYDTNPNLGWGPNRNLWYPATWNEEGDHGKGAIKDGKKVGNIPTPYQYYNTTFTPTSDIRNNAILAGDFFEIPPYEFEMYNNKQIKPGRYLLSFDSPAQACVGPYVHTPHFDSNTPDTDKTWIGQRVVWDINYL